MKKNTYWQDKIVLITGGSSGFGREIAEGFAREGAKIILAALEPEILDAAVKEMRIKYPETYGFPVNITQEGDVQALFKYICDHFGALDCLVNAAGRTDRGKIIDCTAEHFQKIMELNFIALTRVTQHFLPLLLQTHGHIINIGSLASKAASRWTGAYPASKHAVAAYSQQLRLELQDTGLKVLLVCPGPIQRETERLYPLEGLEDLPETARRPGAGVKVKRIPPEKLVTQILRSAEKGLPEIVMPGKARFLFTICQLWPRLGDWLILKNT
ncbi:MAG: SDR family NAD(P)-dependent oxidoreductase [Planctomycetia bacterium]|nr:SDR family NAD(P)-dependent oxidoreductase [Planctomycetia bacterium]